MSARSCWLSLSVHCAIVVFLPALVAMGGCGDDDGMPVVDARPDSPDTGIVDASTSDGATRDAGSTSDAMRQPDAMPPPDAIRPPPDAMPPDAMLPDAMPPRVAPPFRNPVALPDQDLATQALALLGTPGSGGVDRCGGCHGVTRQKMRFWRALSDDSLASCLTDLEVSTPESANAMLDCLRSNPADSGTPFAASKLGIYTTAADLEWFAFVFETAFGDAGNWENELDIFQQRVAMPRGGTQYNQGEFDIIAEWFARGLPLLDDLMPADPPPTTCQTGISADVPAHVADMAVRGWRAANQENHLLMFGCEFAIGGPLGCLGQYSRAGEEPYAVTWEHLPGATIRILHKVSYDTAFWSRSSADGRFVAHGSATTGDRARIIDLFRANTIPANALYDPAFFPDNSGFVFQRGQAAFCEQSLLTSGPARIDFNEPECNSTGAVGLYQQVGTALGGGDYWAVAGQFVSDNGGLSPTLSDLRASFSSTAALRITPMINIGNGYMPLPNIRIDTPFEGDTVLSPSAELLVSRVAGPGDQQIGYIVRKLIATPDGAGYTVQTPEIARYCLTGGKPGISYDERWMVIHNYVDDSDAVELGYSGPTDPAFQPYRTQGAANLYLIDLLTGERIRITHMGPGQYALFPYFRSDGWIYAEVRMLDKPFELVIASDAALVTELP